MSSFTAWWFEAQWCSEVFMVFFHWFSLGFQGHQGFSRAILWFSQVLMWFQGFGGFSGFVSQFFTCVCQCFRVSCWCFLGFLNFCDGFVVFPAFFAAVDFRSFKKAPSAIAICQIDCFAPLAGRGREGGGKERGYLPSQTRKELVWGLGLGPFSLFVSFHFSDLSLFFWVRGGRRCGREGVEFFFGGRRGGVRRGGSYLLPKPKLIGGPPGCRPSLLPNFSASLKPFSAISPTPCFLPFMKAVLSSTNTLNSRGVNFVIPYTVRPVTQCARASNSTLTEGYWPSWSGSAPPHILQTATSTNVRSSRIAHAELSGKIEMCRPSPHHWTTDQLERFRQVKNQCYRSLVFFSCMVTASPSLRPSVASHRRDICVAISQPQALAKLPTNESS